MPYRVVSPRRVGDRLVLEIELPSTGEPSKSGRAENLIDPIPWLHIVDEADELDIKIAVCRRYRTALRRGGSHGTGR